MRRRSGVDGTGGSVVKWLIISAVVLTGLGSAQARAQTPGDWVLARYRNGPYWFPGVIDRIAGDRITIRYDDGDRETLYADKVRPYDWRIGTRVECNFRGAGRWYPGRIAALAGADLRIDYDDGDRERTSTGRCRSQ